MNPAVGVTKILNNLQECITIIEEINKRNSIILPKVMDINEFTEYKKKLIGVLSDEKLESIEQIAQVSQLTADIEKFKDNLSQSIETYVTTHRIFLDHLAESLDNAKGRIKKLKGENRVDWFNLWQKSETQLNTFKNIITGFSNWEYPVMEIFPGNGEMLQYALSGEPLYIVDWDNVLLEKVSSQFNEYYATKRLMKYKIDNFDLSTLPQNSFGFIYSLNYLNFEKIDSIVDLAKSVLNCLLPGGIYLFVYNNSNDWWSVKNTVSYFYGLVDSNDLNKSLSDVGFEVQQIVRSEELNMSYVIAKKPGEIEYIKNSSILANIIDKPNDLM